MISMQAATAAVRHHTGVVIPVYLPTEIDTSRGEALLRDTVGAACVQVEDPGAVCLSVDGARYGEPFARQLKQRWGVTVEVAPRNRGKLQAARFGVNRVLENPEIDYAALIDQDGDHFPNELLNFVRAAMYIEDRTKDERVMILGQRRSLHRPLGWVRGELELFADRVLLNALRYHAAITDAPLALEFTGPVGTLPDFHSGYKLFSRATATAVFDSPPARCGLTEDAAYRHACEAVMTVEAHLSGAHLGLVNRSTFNQQPISTFSLFDRHQLTIDMIAWPCKRLGIPPAFVRQWLVNVVPCLTLDTLVPEGREILAAIVAGVTEKMGEQASPRASSRRTPLFT